jgi:hypothetical protein
MKRRTLILGATLAPVICAGTGLALIVASTGLPVKVAAEQVARIAAAKVGSVLYSNDLIQARTLAEQRGQIRVNSSAPVFVPEKPDAPHLQALRNRYDLESVIANASSEYDAQLKLAAWVGTRFEHGTDEVPGGRQVCDPVAVFQAGESGKRFWCEIAASSMIHAASAVGWPARMITASTDGHTWEHAVAELWSKQYQKWFVVDTDFNVVFEHQGVPLSAWELVHEAPRLKLSGQLTVKRFAKFKEGLVPQDLLRLYAYAHVDYRTDWCTRPLRTASPAGGDLNTRWTARPGLEPKLTPIIRANTQAEFELPMSATLLAPQLSNRITYQQN